MAVLYNDIGHDDLLSNLYLFYFCDYLSILLDAILTSVAEAAQLKNVRVSSDCMLDNGIQYLTAWYKVDHSSLH
jgi:hypothetical protein